MENIESRIDFRRVRDFSQTINDSFAFIKQNFKDLILPVLYICGFFLVATMASAVMQQLKTVRLLGLAKASTTKTYSTEFSSYAFGVEYVLLILFSVLTVGSIYLVTYCYIKLYKDRQNSPPSTEDVWHAFKHHALRYFIAMILLTALLVIGFLFCLIPGCYLLPIVTLALPIMVLEERSMTDSFSRSMHLLKDNWWKTFGLILISGLIAYFSMGILGLPGALLNIFALFLEDSPNLVLAGSIFSSILTGMSQIIYILPAIVSALWYYSLSEEKDGQGLLERIENFGSGEGKTPNDWPEEEY